MWDDPISDEIHRIRTEHAEAFNNDLQAIAADLRKTECQHSNVVSRDPKLVPTKHAA